MLDFGVLGSVGEDIDGSHFLYLSVFSWIERGVFRGVGEKFGLIQTVRGARWDFGKLVERWDTLLGGEKEEIQTRRHYS